MIRLASLPEGQTGQALAVAAPVCILLAFMFGIVQPGLQWYGARQGRLALEQKQLAYILAQQHVLPQLRQQADAAGDVFGGTHILLAGSSDAIAGANLQSTLMVLANNSGSSMTSAAALPVQPLGSLRRVGVEVDVTATLPALTDLLTAIENAQPRMTVDDLSVSSAAGSAAGDTDTSLQASFSVSAFRSGEP